MNQSKNTFISKTILGSMTHLRLGAIFLIALMLLAKIQHQLGAIMF